MIELKNGNMVNVFNLDDCCYYIGESMGYDFEKEVKAFLMYTVDTIKEERNAYKEEFENYEASNENYIFSLNDIREAITEMVKNTRITKVQKEYVNRILEVLKNF